MKHSDDIAGNMAKRELNREKKKQKKGGAGAIAAGVVLFVLSGCMIGFIFLSGGIYSFFPDKSDPAFEEAAASPDIEIGSEQPEFRVFGGRLQGRRLSIWKDEGDAAELTKGDPFAAVSAAVISEDMSFPAERREGSVSQPETKRPTGKKTSGSTGDTSGSTGGSTGGGASGGSSGGGAAGGGGASGGGSSGGGPVDTGAEESGDYL